MEPNIEISIKKIQFLEKEISILFIQLPSNIIEYNFEIYSDKNWNKKIEKKKKNNNKNNECIMIHLENDDEKLFFKINFLKNIINKNEYIEYFNFIEVNKNNLVDNNNFNKNIKMIINKKKKTMEENEFNIENSDSSESYSNEILPNSFENEGLSFLDINGSNFKTFKNLNSLMNNGNFYFEKNNEDLNDILLNNQGDSKNNGCTFDYAKINCINESGNDDDSDDDNDDDSENDDSNDDDSENNDSENDDSENDDSNNDDGDSNDNNDNSDSNNNDSNNDDSEKNVSNDDVNSDSNNVSENNDNNGVFKKDSFTTSDIFTDINNNGNNNKN